MGTIAYKPGIFPSESKPELAVFRAPGLIWRLPAGGPVYFTTHITGFVRRQEDEKRREFRRLSGASEHGVSSELLDFFARTGGRDQRSPNRAWCDGVNANPLRYNPFRKGFGEINNGGLGRSIEQKIGAGIERLDGSRVDDGAARLHVREGGAAPARTSRRSWL
jgi:hypothetical protein